MIDDFADATLPTASFAVNVTTVVPGGSIAGMSETSDGFGSTRSTARAPARYTPTVGLDAGTATAEPRVIGAGTVSLGGDVSRTATVNEPLAPTPSVFFAVHATVVEPSLNVEPLFGAQLIASGGIGSAPSSAETAYVTTAPFGPVASTTLSAGTWSVGAAVLIVHECAAGVESALPAASIARTANECVPSPSPA